VDTTIVSVDAIRVCNQSVTCPLPAYACERSRACAGSGEQSSSGFRARVPNPGSSSVDFLLSSCGCLAMHTAWKCV
jgi:hypothetical protein